MALASERLNEVAPAQVGGIETAALDRLVAERVERAVAERLDAMVAERIAQIAPARIDEVLAKKLDEALAAREAARTPSMTIIATKGTLDWAYPPFILASTGAALGWDVSMFFTFYGLELLRKDLRGLEVSPLGNPAMPMKMPMGPAWFRSIRWNVPNMVQSLVPGYEAFATRMMRKTIRSKGVADIAELRSLCIEAGVDLIGCQMTVDLFGYQPKDFIPEVKEF
ncbi:MAG: DsrE/DsrF/DrsH-like family protein, partial [Casimicrobiaceae bacterium]